MTWFASARRRPIQRWKPWLRKIMEQIQKDGRGASGAEKGKERYRAALTRAWERLGYPKELAQIRTDLIFTKETGDMEWLAEKAKDCQIRKEKRAQVYKLIGDIKRKQGQTDAAFDNYKKAVDCGGKGYVNIELYRIFSQIFWKAANGLRHTQRFWMLPNIWITGWADMEAQRSCSSL